jgi:hypothetical protein
MLASKRLDGLYSFEITVAAKSSAIDARSPSHVGKHFHAGLNNCRRVNRFWAMNSKEYEEKTEKNNSSFEILLSICIYLLSINLISSWDNPIYWIGKTIYTSFNTDKRGMDDLWIIYLEL